METIQTNDPRIELAYDRSGQRIMKCLLIDLDGTLYRGESPIPQAKGFMESVQKAGVPFVLLTNCPLHSPQELSEKLRRMDICVPAERILTSGSVCAQYLGAQFPGESVLAVGSDSFAALLADQGLKLWRQGEEDPAAVAVGYSTQLDYDELCWATHYLRQGKTFLATNGDAVIPSGDRLVPHTGAVVEYLKTASGQTPLVIGKPYAFMLEAALQKLSCRKEDCLVLGDGLETDFAFAVRNGLDYRILLSGVTTREAALQRGVPAEKLCENLLEVTMA